MQKSKQQIALRFRDAGPPADSRRVVAGVGYSLERVAMHGGRVFDYKWTGSSNYLATHNIRLDDGQTVLSDAAPQRRLDLRQRMTFAPRGATVSGWSSLAGSENSYTALFFEPDLLSRELERSGGAELTRPKLYFKQSDLCTTLSKLDALLQSPDQPDTLLVETLSLLAVLELDRLAGGSRLTPQVDAGGLSLRQVKQARDYIEANLAKQITLLALANAVGLSRYHFARAFKRSTGVSPLRFVQQRRVARARDLLAHTDMPVEAIAAATGFSSGRQFSAVFAEYVGQSPREYRRSRP